VWIPDRNALEWRTFPALPHWRRLSTQTTVVSGSASTPNRAASARSNVNASATEIPPQRVVGGSWLASPRVVLGLSAATVCLVLAGVVVAVLGGGFLAFVLLPFTVFGAVIGRRQPGNPIAVILLVLAVAVTGCSDAGHYAVLVYQRGYHLPLGRAAVFLAPGAWAFLVVLLPLPLALFPDGRLTRRWQRLLWCYLIVCVAFVATAVWQNTSGLLARHIQVNRTGELVSNSPAIAAPVYKVILCVYLLFCLAWIARLLFAFRRSTGDYRQQLKWVLSAGAGAVSGLALEFFFSNTNSPALHAVGNVALGVSLLALPVAFAIGILKYRLYEIDRLISRTLSYALLTGLLVGVFVGLVLLTTRILPFSSPVGVAASTLAAAGLFSPLRTRLQRLVDRRFNRARYDTEATVAALAVRLRDAVDVETVRDELAAAAAHSLQPAHLTVWVRS